MRAELQLLKAMTDIDDKYLAELETDNRKSVKKTRISKPARWLLVAIIVLCISTAAYAAIQWNPVFMDWFKPTDAIIEQTAAGVQNVGVISQCGDYTLRVDQTIGDENTLYLNLEISLPEGVIWRDVLPEDVWKMKEEVTLTPKFEFYRGELLYEDINGLSKEEFKAFTKGRNFSTASSGVTYDNLQVDSNSMSYMIRHSTDDLTAEPISLVINQFDEGMEPIVMDGFPLVISWTPENSGKQYLFEFEDGETRGELQLSAFRLHIKMYRYPKVELYEKGYEFAKDIVLHMKDRSRIPVSKLSNGSGGSLSRYYIDYSYHFRSILNLDEVEAIQINDYRFELE